MAFVSRLFCFAAIYSTLAIASLTVYAEMPSSRFQSSCQSCQTGGAGYLPERMVYDSACTTCDTCIDQCTCDSGCGTGGGLFGGLWDGIFGSYVPSAQHTQAPSMIGGFMSASNTYRATNADFVSSPNPGFNRLDLSENQSASLRNRFFINASHYDNAYNSGNVFGVNRDSNIEFYTLGLEHVLIDDVLSIDFRLPFASGTEINQPNVHAGLSGSTNDLGNASLIFKYLLDETCDQYLLTTGFALTMPTGSDASVGDPVTAAPPVEISNNSFYLSPFLMAYYAPSPVWYSQLYVSFDFSLNGDEVSGNTLANNVSVAQQHLFKLDGQLGRWLYKRPEAYTPCTYFELPLAGITGIAAVAEFHYVAALNDPDVAVFAPNRLLTTSAFGQYDVMNVTAGTTIEFGKRSSINAGFSIPVTDVTRGGNVNLYDRAFLVQWNLYFPTSEVRDTHQANIFGW